MTHIPKDYTNQELLDLLQTDSEKAINYLFTRDYSYLCQTAYRILKETNQAEDIVQDVFYEFWKKRDVLQIKTSIKAYLKRAVINKTLNFIRDQKIRLDDEAPLQFLDSKENIQQNLEADEMKILIDKALEGLPPKCKAVFALSRFEQMSYQEIATQLNISTKTVENHISKALKRLRVSLSPYIKFLLILITILQ
ncbi:MAG: RNA polymerase sigma-70 factor [Bacteroidota bacterium]